MSLSIIKAGIADTIQDMGRYGWQWLGINPTGAMDKFSAKLANILVGNSDEEAVIEMHFPASVFLFEQAALIAVTGADFSATINGEPLTCRQPVIVNKNGVLQFHEHRKGARAYLAVQGGFEVPKWLDSYSTNLKAKAGGYQGRAFQKDDEISFKQKNDYSEIISDHEISMLPFQADDHWDHTSIDTIFYLPGNEWEWLTAESKESFEEQVFIINPGSDRMGYRLSAGLLHTTTQEELVSAAVCFGTLQLLPDGRLVLLMADHQTTGGYPRIAHVITAHHSRLAQLKPGDPIKFRRTNPQTAEMLLKKQQQHLRLLKNACQLKTNEFGNVKTEKFKNH